MPAKTKRLPKLKTNYSPRKSSVRLAVSALLILALLILFGKLLSFLFFLNSPLTGNLTGPKLYSWDSKSNINVVFVTVKDNQATRLSLLSFSPKDQSATVLHIPGKTYLDLPKGYGLWKVGSVYPLGQEESPPQGALLLKLSTAKLLGLPVDGIVVSDSGAGVEELASQFHSNPISVLSYPLSQKTDLSLLESVKLFWALSRVRPDKIKTLDFERSDLTESVLLPDSTRVLGVDTIKLDLFVRQNLADSQMSEESASVVILNATKHSGLAQEAARVVTNMGANVVIVSNSENFQDRSSVVLQKGIKLDQNTSAKRLTEVFAPVCLKQRCDSLDPKINTSRAQITVILGEDYYNLWHKR